MKVDAGSAKEKMARAIDGAMVGIDASMSLLDLAAYLRDYYVQVIRNTDLTDCQQTDTSKAVPTDMRERCASLLSRYKSPWATEKNHLLTEIAAAIRALPDQNIKDCQK